MHGTSRIAAWPLDTDRHATKPLANVTKHVRMELVPDPASLARGARSWRPRPDRARTGHTQTAAPVAPPAGVAPVTIVDLAIAQPPTAQPGDPTRGQRQALDRSKGNCIACHEMPVTAISAKAPNATRR